MTLPEALLLVVLVATPARERRENRADEAVRDYSRPRERRTTFEISSTPVSQLYSVGEQEEMIGERKRLLLLLLRNRIKRFYCHMLRVSFLFCFHHGINEPRTERETIAFY